MATRKKAPRARSFAELLAERRAVAGSDERGRPAPMSYRELAARTDGAISPQMLNFVERGQREPPRSVPMLQALARALGNTTFEELMEAAGYLRPAGLVGDAELARALARTGLDERGVEDVMRYIRFRLSDG